MRGPASTAPRHGGFGTTLCRGHGRRGYERRPRARRARLRRCCRILRERQTTGQRGGVIGGVLRRRVMWRRIDDVLRRSVAGRRPAAPSMRTSWRRGVTSGVGDLRGRLSKLAVRDESGDDARLLQAKACVADRGARSGDVSRSKPCARRSRGRARWPRARRAARYPGAT